MNSLTNKFLAMTACPWEFLWPFLGKHYAMVIIDLYSKWPEVSYVIQKNCILEFAIFFVLVFLVL